MIRHVCLLILSICIGISINCFAYESSISITNRADKANMASYSNGNIIVVWSAYSNEDSEYRIYY